MNSNSAGGAGKEGGGGQKTPAKSAEKPIGKIGRTEVKTRGLGGLLLTAEALKAANVGIRPPIADRGFANPLSDLGPAPSLNMGSPPITSAASESGARENRKTMERQYALRAKFRNFWAEFKEDTQNKERCDPAEMNNIFEAVTDLPDTSTLNLELAAVPFEASDQVAEDVARVLDVVFTKLNAMLHAGADVPMQYVTGTANSAKNWLIENKDMILNKLYMIAQWCGGAFALWLIRDNIANLFTNVWGITTLTGASAGFAAYILNRIGKDATVVNTLVVKFIDEADFTTMGYETVGGILPTIIETLKSRRDERSLDALTTFGEKLSAKIALAADKGTEIRRKTQMEAQLDALNQDIANMKKGKRGGRNTRRKRQSMKTKAKKHNKKSHKRHTK